MGKSKSKIIVRRWKIEDIPGVIECSRKAYSDYTEDYIFTPRHYEMQYSAFPTGQFVAIVDGKVAGYATSVIVNIEDDFWYNVDEITGAGTFSTHNPDGDTLYGADIAVDPEYRKRGIAMMLYKKRKSILQRNNLKRMIAYGRIPGYKDYAGKMSADQYVRKVIAGELRDSALNAHLKAGFQVKKVQLDITEDASSLNYSTYLEMLNPDYNIAKKRITAAYVTKRSVRRLRICGAQYHMRPIREWQEMEDSVEFFVNTADSYHCHFLMFPENFTHQMISCLNGNDMKEMIRMLAGMTDRYVEMFTRFAEKYNIYIIGGSHPTMREGLLYNTAYLFTPTGKVYTQDKLHITSVEREECNIEPGTSLKIFQTPFARIAIQVCYDIEFPELSRLLTLAGVEVIFVPFYTEEKKAYYRVRHCAHARAVENFVYVAMTGNVGNMKTKIGSFMNYSQAAILAPSDFSFPEKGIEGSADPNVEAVVVSELALFALAQQRHVATVRPLHDRRLDLYDLKAKNKIEIIRTE